MNHKIDGKYLVIYKNPKIYHERNKGAVGRVSTFEGVCENFSTGLSAFRNDQNQLLLVDYQDIIQLKPLEVKSDV